MLLHTPKCVCVYTTICVCRYVHQFAQPKPNIAENQLQPGYSCCSIHTHDRSVVLAVIHTWSTRLFILRSEILLTPFMLLKHTMTCKINGNLPPFSTCLCTRLLLQVRQSDFYLFIYLLQVTVTKNTRRAMPDTWMFTTHTEIPTIIDPVALG